MIRLTILAVLLTATVGSAQTPQAGNPHGDMDLDCRFCHTEQGWDVDDRNPAFDHDGTGFPLEGAHVGAACRDCHREPVFAHVGTACADCHTDAHRGRLGIDCAACHTSNDWVDPTEARRAHDGTRMPLVGAHARVDCDACHTGPVAGEYVGTQTDCYACHRPDYEATTDPGHLGAGFGTDCERCHGVFAATWGAGDFNHPPSFPLIGAHGGLDCRECHTDGFSGAPTDCVSCHRSEYDNTSEPVHPAAGFSTDCAACHRTTAWVPSTWDHDVTAFSLTGDHRRQDCVACHDTGYVGTPTDCYACHQSDYDGTTEPVHPAAGFGTDCAACHGTSAWEPSTWDHEERFPIASGPHTETSCVECHVVPTDYKAFECILCHEHDRTDTDADHDEITEPPPYVYASPNCYECHPRGRS
ncbi:MAG: hypothetical protein GY838_15890 [bacterium]|nr:hypothetical protein [bacterium]